MTATDASLARAYVGTSGWSYPSWRPELLPRRGEAARVPAPLLRAAAERRAEHDRLQDSGRGPVHGAGPSRRADGFQFAVKFNAYRFGGAGTFEERVRLLGDRLGPIRVLVGSARDEGLLALTLGSFDPELRIAFDFRHDSWEDVEADLPPNAVRVNDLDGSRRSGTCACASRPTTTPRSRNWPSGSARCWPAESTCTAISSTRTSRRRPGRRSAS